VGKDKPSELVSRNVAWGVMPEKLAHPVRTPISRYGNNFEKSGNRTLRVIAMMPGMGPILGSGALSLALSRAQEFRSGADFMFKLPTGSFW
jgi:hypothetical protein